MDAKRCDRCKRFYLESDNVKKRPNYAGHRLFSVRALDSNWDRLSTYELCADCANAFISWLKMGDCDTELVDAKYSGKYSGPEPEGEVANGTN